MKPRLFSIGLLLPAALVSFAGSASAVTKADNTTALNGSGSWVGGLAPGSADVALFDATILAPLSVNQGGSTGTNLTWASIQLTNPGGAVTINQNGANNTLTLNTGGIDMSSATADLTLNSGTVRIATGNFGATLNVASGRTLTLNSFINQGSTKTATLTGLGNIIFNGAAGSGTMAFNITGGANVTMNSATNSWSAGTIAAGSLTVGNTTALQNQTITNNAATGLKFGTGITSATIGNLAGSGSFALTNADTNAVSLSIGGNNSTQTYSGVLSGAGALTKTGTGTVTLSTSGQGYAGVTNVSGGTLQLSGSGNTQSNLIGTGALNLSGGGRVRFNSTSATTLTGDLDVGTGGGTLSFRGNSALSASTITGTGTLTLDIDNGITLTPNTFNGFGGTVNVSSSGAAATLRLGGSFANASLGNAKLDLGAGIAVTRNAGTNSTITTDIGTLSGAATSSIGGSGAGTGTYTFSVGSRDENSTYAGSIADGGTKTALTKVGGNATLTLTGTNTYTGATTVSAGTLLVNGSLGNTAVAVNNGGTLGGTNGVIGTGTASLTVNNGGALAPGSSPGTLTVNGSTTLNSGSNYNYQYTGGGTAADLLDVNGILTINTGAILNLQDLASYNPGDKFTLFAYESLIGTFDSYANNSIYTVNGGDWLFNYSDGTAGQNGGTVSGIVGSGFVTMTAIPEPNAAMLLGGFGVIALLRRRRA